MRKLVITQTKENNAKETVPAAVVNKLYILGKLDDSNHTITYGVDTSNVKRPVTTVSGAIIVPVAYMRRLEYLATKYPNLDITANSIYIDFADPIVELTLLSGGIGDGTGITVEDAQALTAFPRMENSTLQEELPSMNPKHFDLGRFAFYKSNVTTFNELGQFSNITYLPSMMFNASLLSSIDLSNIKTLYPGVFRRSQLTGVINIPKFENFPYRDYNISGYNMNGGLFQGCSNITEINLGADVLPGLRVSSIPGDAFRECTSLTSITGLDEVTTIEGAAFRDCSSITNLSDLNNNVLAIGANSFLNCSNLQCINISNCTTMRSEAFRGCSNLLALDTNDLSKIDDNDTYTLNCTFISKDNVFYGTKLTGKTIILSSLTQFGTGFFSNSLVKKVKALNVTSIGGGAFYGCSLLQELELGDVTTILGSVFNGCSSLSTIKFGNLVNDVSNLTSIGLDAFNKELTPSLTLSSSTLNLPNLTSLGIRAFRGRTELTSVTNLGSITSIPNSAFYNCTNLTSINFPETLTTLEVPDMTALVDVIGKEGLTKMLIRQIDSYNSVMKYIEIPSSCTDMGASFHRCFEHSSGIDIRVIIKATTPPTLNVYGNETTATDYGARKFAGIYVPDNALADYQNAGGAWERTSIQERLKPISLLQTDSSYCWNKYLLGLNNS